METATLFVLLSSLAGSDVPVGASIAQELTDIHRGMSPRSIGYLDAGQIQNLCAVDREPHQAYGTLHGFREVRRVTGIVMGPDSATVFRYGLMGSWQSGGWTKDLYLASAPSLNQSRTRWAAGLAARHLEQDWFAAAGWFHVDPESWKDDRGYRTEDPDNALWAQGRFRRFGMIAATGTDGPRFARIGYLPDPEPFGKYAKKWFLPQLEAAVNWSEADWNPWSDQAAFGAEVRAGLLAERLSGRLEAGMDGFRLIQLQSNLDPEGNVGVDLSWARARGGNGPGIRLRVPFLTFSMNDPDDIAAFGVSGRGIVWSLRIVMTWEKSQGWYRPGRRLSSGGGS